MANNNRKNTVTGKHGVTLAASAMGEATEQRAEATITEIEAEPTNEAPTANEPTVEGQPTAEPTTAQLVAMVASLANTVNVLQGELQRAKAVAPTPPATGAALIPMAQVGTLARRHSAPSAREVASFTSKRHVGLVKQLAPNHYVELAENNSANVAGMVIKLLVAHNPKRQFSQQRFAKYKSGQTVAQYIEACKNVHGGSAYTCLRDLAYDCNRQYIALLPAGSKVDATAPITPIEARTTLGPMPVATNAETARALAFLRASLQ